MTVVLLSGDLTVYSRVAGAAERAGMAVQMVSTVAQAVERCAQQPTTLVIIDLSLLGVDPADLVTQLQAADVPPSAIVAFGPHVHEDRLAAARAAGCTEVLSRGQFMSQLDAVLRR